MKSKLSAKHQLAVKELSECKASESNIRRIQVKDIVKEVEDHLKTYSSAGMDISWSRVINVPAFDEEDFTSWKVRFMVFLDGLKPYLLKTLDLLENQKMFYKRSGWVGSARKPLDKTKETCFACRKLGQFQKECPSHKTSTPSYPSSNNSFNKSKPYTPSFNQTSSQNSGNHQKDYKGKYKGLKAEMVVLTKRIDDMTKGKSEKGKKEKDKSEKGLLAESFE
ncbi:retrovirus-related pol polyprotein from transposon TNT 1-94 [Tanacetum coccineum]